MPLWERPWPRHGRCCPQASIQAAVGVKTPPTEPRTGSGRRSGACPCGSGLGRDTAAVVRRLRSRSLSGSSPLPQNLARAPATGLAHAPVGAASAATRPRAPQASMQAAVGVKTPPTEPRSGSGRRSGPCPCGSGLGRDTDAAVRRLRSRPPSGPEDPSHRTPHGLRPRVWRMPLWEQPRLRHGPALRGPRCRPLSGSRPLPQSPARAPAAGLAHAPVGAALAATRPSRSARGCCPGRKTSPTNPGAALIGLAARRRRELPA